MHTHLGSRQAEGPIAADDLAVLLHQVHHHAQLLRGALIPVWGQRVGPVSAW
jgi:hypothetical protein